MVGLPACRAWVLTQPPAEEVTAVVGERSQQRVLSDEVAVGRGQTTGPGTGRLEQAVAGGDAGTRFLLAIAGGGSLGIARQDAAGEAGRAGREIHPTALGAPSRGVLHDRAIGQGDGSCAIDPAAIGVAPLGVVP